MKRKYSVLFVLIAILSCFSTVPIVKAGGAGFLGQVTANKTTAIANGTDEITITVFTFYNQCNGTLTNGIGEVTHPVAATYDANTASTWCSEATTQHDSTYSVLPVDYSPPMGPLLVTATNGVTLSATSLPGDATNGYRSFTVKSSVATTTTITVDAGYNWSGHNTVALIFTAPATSNSATTTTNNTSNSAASSSSSGAVTANTSTSPTPPAAPILESLTVGNTSLAADKILDNKLAQNGKKVFSGKTIPNGVVHLYFHSDPFEDTATADANGVWVYTLTNNIGAGDHELQIAVTDPVTNLTSEKSAPVKFALAEAVSEKTEAKKAAPTIEQKQNYVWYYVGAGVFVAVVIGMLVYFFVFKHGVFTKKKKATETESLEK